MIAATGCPVCDGRGRVRCWWLNTPPVWREIDCPRCAGLGVVLS